MPPPQPHTHTRSHLKLANPSGRLTDCIKLCVVCIVPVLQAKRSHVGVSTPLTAAAGIAAAAEGGSERADDEEQRHQRAKLPDGRHHPTPNGNGGDPAAEAAAPTRGGRRVTFDLPPSASATGRGGGGHAHGSGSGGGSQGGGGSYGGGGRGWGGRGRGRGRAVPDHVVHPERYTVYTLDEPIYVGQGDKGRGAWGREEAENKEVGAGADRQAGFVTDCCGGFNIAFVLVWGERDWSGHGWSGLCGLFSFLPSAAHARNACSQHGVHQLIAPTNTGER